MIAAYARERNPGEVKKLASQEKQDEIEIQKGGCDLRQ
jgi:hypothetical protein